MTISRSIEIILEVDATNAVSAFTSLGYSARRDPAGAWLLANDPDLLAQHRGAHL